MPALERTFVIAGLFMADFCMFPCSSALYHRAKSCYHAAMFEKEALQSLLQRYNQTEIANLHGCDPGNVAYWRKKFGLERLRGRARQTTLNEDFFSTIDSEAKAYVLGFLTADGYVHKNLRTVSIALQERDLEALELIRRHLGSNANIGIKISRGGYSTGSRQGQVNFSSKKLVLDLAQYGVVPGKTATAFYPTLPTEEMDRHFIRGVWDGDGNICDRNFSVIGTRSLLDGIQERVKNFTGCSLSHCPCRTTPRLVGYRRDRDAIRWMYEGSTLFLRRKYDKFAEHWL